MIGCAGTIVDDMVELLCANLQKDDLAAINASLSADDTTSAAKEALLKVRRSNYTLWLLVDTPLSSIRIIPEHNVTAASVIL